MNTNLTTFFIVRHGESTWNIERKVQGQTDVPLTPRGEEQAQELAAELKNITFDEILSSDLIRARRTAEIINLERKLEIKTTEALRERSFGKYEGISGDDFLHLFLDWEKMSEEERWNKRMADEETGEEAVSRFITFLRGAAIAYEGKRVLVVCHGGIMRAFLIKLGYGTWDSIGGFQNCGYIHIESDGVDFFMKEAKGIMKWQDVEATVKSK